MNKGLDKQVAISANDQGDKYEATLARNVRCKNYAYHHGHLAGRQTHVGRY